jgi:hypothetical protein
MNCVGDVSDDGERPASSNVQDENRPAMGQASCRLASLEFSPKATAELATPHSRTIFVLEAIGLAPRKTSSLLGPGESGNSPRPRLRNYQQATIGSQPYKANHHPWTIKHCAARVNHCTATFDNHTARANHHTAIVDNQP